MFSERGMKPVLHFHFPTDVLCPDGLPVVVYLFSFLVDAYRNDVHVFAVDVFVQLNYIGLVPVTELFHTIYGEKKSLAFLYKLAEETRKLEELCKQIIELTKRFEKEYLTKKE